MQYLSNSRRELSNSRSHNYMEVSAWIVDSDAAEVSSRNTVRVVLDIAAR